LRGGTISLQRYVLKRVVEIAPVVFGITVFVFLISRLAPGDPATAILGAQATDAAIQRITEKWGLNQPLYIQYINWVGNVLQGDLGTSIAYNLPVLEILIRRSIKTFQLMLSSIVISIFVGIPMGVYSALNRNTTRDGVFRVLSLVFVSVPRFWSALILILVFAFYIPILPQSGLPSPTENPVSFLQHIILPAIALGLYYSAYIMRMMRSNMLDELGQDYITTAKAMGVGEFEIYYKDALKNAFIPTFTIIGLTVAYILNGTVLVEVVFGIAGIGQALVASIFNRDYPLIQGVVLYIALIFVTVNTLVDILYSYFDPRIKY